MRLRTRFSSETQPKQDRPRGRFAPTPSGPLHFGSLIAALGSYLSVKGQGGQWLVRIEDIDLPRVVPGAAEEILKTLEAFALNWDGEVVYQSARGDLYRDALASLRARNQTYSCACSRKELALVTRRGLTGELLYPGTCRSGLKGRTGRAERFRVPDARLCFDDAIQGTICQDLAVESGDFTLLRADQIVSYHLAVVVDDAAQGITEIVRGSDLMDSTPRHLALQRALGLPEPKYAHLPVACDGSGEKLSKQTRAAALAVPDAPALLIEALRFLGQDPTPDLQGARPSEIVAWGLRHWSMAAVPKERGRPLVLSQA